MRNPKQSPRTLLRRAENSSALQSELARGMAILAAAKPLLPHGRHHWLEGWKPSHDIQEGIGK